jgi:hypothetical protein
MRIASLAASAAALIAISAPVQAAEPTPAIFNLGTGNNNNVADGNARFFSATSAQLGTYNVRITGWSLQKVNGVTYIRDSKLMVYSPAGLSIISGDDDNGADNQHTIDNEGWKDFLVLQFDRNVKLTTASFTTYSVVGSNPKDSDATIMAGDTSLAYTSSLTSLLNDKNSSVLSTVFNKGSWESLGGATDNTRDINPNRVFGDIWLIGASFTNADGKIDGFKLNNLAVIPEPATWAMMIGGFGLVGGMARRRNAVTRAIA